MTIVLLLISLLAGLVGTTFAGFTGAQAKARDTERKTDINFTFQKLEEHYNEYGEYPTESELTLEYDTLLPGLDAEALYDPDGNFIQQGDYTYKPSVCTALGCQEYELSAHLETEEKFIKQSLN